MALTKIGKEGITGISNSANANAITIDSGENVALSGTLGVTGAITGTLATAAQTNITSVGTLTSFRSTGIDDNADALAITIDASERVGIGTTSPNDTLHVNGNVFIEGSSPEITFETTNSSNNNWQIACQENVSNALEISVGSADADASNDTFSPVAVFTSSGNVGIGTTSPSLSTASGSASGLEIKGTVPALNLKESSGNDEFLLYGGASSATIYTVNNLRFLMSGSEKMRIDTSGNLLVGKTTTAFGTAGVRILPTGNIYPVANGSVPLEINRLTSDGDIVKFYKDSSAVGSIGVEGGDSLFLQSGTSNGSGLLCHGAGAKILPVRNSTSVDATIDLGQDNRRFKDLYISGGLKVGGTGTANTLDDYEEGTWTPTHTTGAGSGTGSNGTYTKIGRVVHINFTFTFSSGSGAMAIGNLPFVADNHSVGIGREDTHNGYGVYGRIYSGQSGIGLFATSANGNASAYQVGAGGIRFTLAYQTAS